MDSAELAQKPKMREHLNGGFYYDVDEVDRYLQALEKDRVEDIKMLVLSERSRAEDATDHIGDMVHLHNQITALRKELRDLKEGKETKS